MAQNPAPAAATPHPDAIRFLEALYLRAPSGTYIELRPFAPPWADRGLHALGSKWRCWTEVGMAQSAALTAAKICKAGLEVYYGVTLRKNRGGGALDVRCATALWAELDGDISKKGNGCSSKEEAFERLRRIEIVAPSIVVDSGGGLHAYWLLQQPLQGEELANIPMYNARLREALRAPPTYGPDGQMVSSGYAGDDVGDLPRILRLPGTINGKRQHELRPVQLLACDAECTYSLEFLDGHLPQLPEGTFRAGGGGIATEASAEMTWTPELQQKRATLIQDCAGPWSLAEGERHFLPHPVARVLLVAGWPWQDIPSLVGEIARAGGSNMPMDRERDARKELQDRASKSRVGWPWLRSHVPELAEALAKHLNPDGSDLRELAADIAAVRLPAGGPPVAAQPPVAATTRPPLPPAPEPAPPVNNVVPFRGPGIPSLQMLQELSAAAAQQSVVPDPSARAAGDASAPGATVTDIHAGKKAKDRPGKPEGEGRAPEQVFNLLRDRIAWIGRNWSDRRLLAGRKRFVPQLGVEIVETIDLQSSEAEWWALETVRNAGYALTDNHRKIALDMLAAEARHTEVDVAMRFGQAEGGDWLVDLGDSTWQRVRIAAGAWSVEVGPEAMFRRTPCTLPIRDPDLFATSGDLIDGLQAVLGYDDDTCAQLACWLPQAMHPKAPRLGLLLTGPQGSGKSFVARVMRSIVDPCVPPILRFQQKRGEVDAKTFNVHASSQAVLAYDNVSSLSEQASDMLCTLVTGEGYLERKLQTDSDPVLRFGRSGLVLTGISILGMGPDLQDRLLHVGLPVRASNETEEVLERRLAEWAPRLAGGLFAAAADARRLLPEIEAAHSEALAKCRMRDAAAMYAATAAALGFDPGQMLQRLIRDRAEAQGAEAEGDIVGERLLRWVETKRIFGAEIYFDGELDRFAGELLAGDRMPDSWPKSNRGMRAKLARIEPGLRARGISLDFYSASVSRRSCVRLARLSGYLPLADEEAPIMPARFGQAVQTIQSFVDAVGCFADPLVELLAQQRIPQYESWAPAFAAVALLPRRDRDRIFAAVARRYSAVDMPSSGSQFPIRWVENQAGVAASWHAWLQAAL